MYGVDRTVPISKHTGSSLASATLTRLYDFLGFLIAKSATNVE